MDARDNVWVGSYLANDVVVFDPWGPVVRGDGTIRTLTGPWSLALRY